MSSEAATPKTQRTSETQDPTHQVKFLLSVWRNCDGGKVSSAPLPAIKTPRHSLTPVQINWGPVLEEFNINTQGAGYVLPRSPSPNHACPLLTPSPDSAKRLERLLKQYDMKVSQVVKNLPNATKSGGDAGAEPSSAKKRGGDGTAAAPKTPAKKPRATKAKAKATPKPESDEDVVDDDDDDVKLKSSPDSPLKSEREFYLLPLTLVCC